MAVTVPINPTVQRQGIQTGGLRRVSPGTGTEGARQQQALGQALSQQAGVMSEIAVKQQEERNTSQVLAAKTTFDAQAAERLTDARNAQGANAWGVTKRTEEWWQKATSEHIDNMENEAQKQTLRRMFDEKWPSTKANIYSHEVGQQRKAVNDSAKASIQSASDLAVANHNDPNLVNQAITDITRTVKVQQATNEGWTPDVAEAARMSHLTALHKSVIDAKLDENPAAAEAYYEQYKDQIRGSDQPLVEEGLATGKRRRQSQEFVDQMAIEDKSEEEAIAEARKRFEGEDEEEAIDEVTRRFSRREAAISRDQSEAYRQADEILMAEGGSYDAIPNSVLRRLDRASREKLRNEQYGKVTDWPTYYQLRQMAAQQPEAFATTDLTPYFGKLDASKRTEMIKLQTKASENPSDLALGRTKWQVIQQAAGQVGLDPKKANEKNTGDGEKVRSFYRRIDDEILDFSTVNGREPNQSELLKITDRLTAEVVETGFLWDSTRSAGLIEVEGVPTDQIDEIAEAVQLEGVEVSDENIKAWYDYESQKGQ